jgi:hypothetical protein
VFPLSCQTSCTMELEIYQRLPTLDTLTEANSARDSGFRVPFTIASQRNGGASHLFNQQSWGGLLCARPCYLPWGALSHKAEKTLPTFIGVEPFGRESDTKWTE